MFSAPARSTRPPETDKPWLDGEGWLGGAGWAMASRGGQDGFTH